MKKYEFIEELHEMKLIDTDEVRMQNITGSEVFFTKIMMNLRLKIQKNEFIKLTAERFNNFLELKHKEMILNLENFHMYRIAGKLFINRKMGNTWESTRVY